MPQTFKTKKNTYRLEINFGTIFKVTEKTGVDLLNPGFEVDGVTTSQALLYNPALLARVIMALVKDDAQSDDDFLRELDGAAFKAAEAAFWEEYRFFFGRAGRQWLAVALGKELAEKQARAADTARILSGLPGAPSLT